MTPHGKGCKITQLLSGRSETSLFCAGSNPITPFFLVSQFCDPIIKWNKICSGISISDYSVFAECASRACPQELHPCLNESGFSATKNTEGLRAAPVCLHPPVSPSTSSPTPLLKWRKAAFLPVGCARPAPAVHRAGCHWWIGTRWELAGRLNSNVALCHFI